VQRLDKATLIEARLGTGRTHQIRVHFTAIGHPLLGDTTYGKKTSFETKTGKMTIHRQMLHAETLGFTHPHTGEFMEFSSPLPDDMKECIRKLL
jgi:23S rRNA pseudouridine1911/1915/1917 synthase